MNGSSQRAWGLLFHLVPIHPEHRFIPTCVGLTKRPERWQAERAVHPHVRGAYSVHLSLFPFCIGSSPRAWGLLVLALLRQRVPRFIPTCVGLTGQRCSSSCVPAVHPHVRGAYFFLFPAHQPEHGSSPRAWGLPCPRSGVCSQPRFIPTCVGLTSPADPASASAPVHPHVRGAYLPGLIPGKICLGSSPRAWGLLSDKYFSIRSARFIPTCVGLTNYSYCCNVIITVHPHVRGAYSSTKSSNTSGIGSSPRAWGLFPDQLILAVPVRFIPTCVGLTKINVEITCVLSTEDRLSLLVFALALLSFQSCNPVHCCKSKSSAHLLLIPIRSTSKLYPLRPHATFPRKHPVSFLLSMSETTRV